MFDENLVILKERLAQNREQWKFSLIGEFLGYRVMDPEFLTRTLCRIWKTKGAMILLIGNGFLILKFNCEEDKMVVKTEGHWSMASIVLILED